MITRAKSEYGWIRESNLIENVDSPPYDHLCVRRWRDFRFSYLNIWTICDLHAGIMKDHLPKFALGRPRQINVHVGAFWPPDFRDVPRLFAEWAVIHCRPTDWESIRKAHIAFEKLHPFEDGNGRVGRMIMNKQRLDCGLEPLVINAEEKSEYYKWFLEE